MNKGMSFVVVVGLVLLCIYLNLLLTYLCSQLH